GFFAAMLVSAALARLVAQYPSAIGGVTLSIEPVFDGRVLLFGALIAAIVAVLFGVFPALEAVRSGAPPAIKEGRASGGRLARLREFLVVVQVALAATVLVGVGLFARSLTLGYSIDTGFRTDRLILAGVDLNAFPP